MVSADAYQRGLQTVPSYSPDVLPAAPSKFPLSRICPVAPCVQVISDANPPAPGGMSMVPVSMPTNTSPFLSVTVLWPTKNFTEGGAGVPASTGGLVMWNSYFPFKPPDS